LCEEEEMMGEFVWTNNSSKVVRWFAITPSGSVSGDLEPGGEYRHPNTGDTLQVGMQCIDAPVFVIDSRTTESGVDTHLVASDVIHMSSDLPVAAKPSMRMFRLGPVNLKPGETIIERRIEPNEICSIGVDIPDDENLKGAAVVEVSSIRYVRDEDLRTLKVVFTLTNQLNEDALVVINVLAVRQK
jgi:hypothetical protein